MFSFEELCKLILFGVAFSHANDMALRMATWVCLFAGQDSRFGTDWNIRWFAVKSCAGVRGRLRMTHTCCGDSLTFVLGPNMEITGGASREMSWEQGEMVAMQH